MLADFDASVHRIVAQPFSLLAAVDGQIRRHIPDYLWGSDDGPVVVDVVRTERMTQPKIVLLCAWTKAVVQSLGWSYLVVNEPSEIRLGNVRFLSGYRRGRLINSDVLEGIRSSSGQFDGMSIADAEQAIGIHPRALVRPALMGHRIVLNDSDIRNAARICREFVAALDMQTQAAAGERS